MIPQYDLDKIKFATDGSTFERAVGLLIRIRLMKDVTGCQLLFQNCRLACRQQNY